MSDSTENDKIEGILPLVVQTTRAATSVNAQDINFYRSVDRDISNDIDRIGKRLLNITKKLVKSASENSNLKNGKFEDAATIWKSASDSLDSIFERTEIAFDESSKQRGHENPIIELDNASSSDIPTRAISASLPKPQLNFRVKVDNSEVNPFKPKITSKPNALQSFEKSMEIIVPVLEEGLQRADQPHYAQPYEYEILNQPYPENILQSTEPIAPQDWYKTSAEWVDSKEKVNNMLRELERSTEIAIDLEHHDYRSYYGIVCLMQISNREKDWIVDTLVLRDDLEPLNRVFTDPAIIKVFHGAFMDIIWLQRDLGLYVVSLFDTYFASKSLKFPKFSLAYLLETFANFKTSKKYQLADWRIRPLPKPMLAYARSDTHFLLYVFDQLRNKLIQSGESKLQDVLYESRQVARRRFEFTKFRPMSPNSGKVACPVMAYDPQEPYAPLINQFHVPYDRKPLIEALYNWRDEVAKSSDESVRYIMPNQLLVSLSSLTEPVTSGSVLKMSHFASDIFKSKVDEVAHLIQSTLQEMEHSDWQLVDNWHDSTKDDDNKGIEIDKHFILDSNNNFDQENNSESNKFEREKALLRHKSCLLNSDRKMLTFSYNDSKNRIVKCDFGSELANRIAIVQREFTLANTVSLVDFHNDSEDDNSSSHEKSNEEAHQLIQDIKTENLENDTKHDRDEIITLRKRPIHKPKSKTLTSPEAPTDYNNSDKMFLDPKASKRKFESIKKPFDPYSSTEGGPDAAKRTRRQTKGKSATFTNRKKN